MIILEENFKWHLEAFASELVICALYRTGRSADAGQWKLEISSLGYLINTFVGGGQLSILQSQPYKHLVCSL